MERVYAYLETESFVGNSVAPFSPVDGTKALDDASAAAATTRPGGVPKEEAHREGTGHRVENLLSQLQQLDQRISSLKREKRAFREIRTAKKRKL